LENPLDFYQDRDVKKIKSKSLVEELLQDAEFQKFNKRKYQEAVKSKKTSGYNKAHAKMKKLKKK
jgi:Fcf2 pre-rRNA processing